MPLPKERIYTSEDYWNLPDGQRAELINGKLYTMAPPNRVHQEISRELHTIINNYIKSKKGCCKVYAAPFAVNLNKDDETWVEPDISVICNKEKLSDRGCEGTPDWIIEIISPSTQSRDYLKKLMLYQNAGVREYWIVNPRIFSTTVYNFETGESSSYSFKETIPVGILDGLNIVFADFLL